MEILKFDDSEKSLSSKKPFGRGTILVAFIALVFGAGTALAGGTLSINDTNTIALDQGVASTVQCDEDGINVSLVTTLIGEDFYLTGFNLSGIDDAPSPDGCGGKMLTLKVYDENGIQKRLFTAEGVNINETSQIVGADLLRDPTTLSFDFSSFGGLLPTGEIVDGVQFINVSKVTVETSDV